MEKFMQQKHKSLTEHLHDSVLLGRGNLGEEMPVLVYRLLQYTMRDILIQEYDQETSDELFRKAGHLAGTYLAEHMLNLEQELGPFAAELQALLLELKIGVLRFEEFDEQTGHAVVTVSEDLDCSGLPIVGEAVCNYDEGFIGGILEAYTKRPYQVHEVDCWGKGDRICRFDANGLG